MQDILLLINQHPILTWSAVLIVLALIPLELLRMKRRVAQVTPHQAVQLINREDANVIDIRPLATYQTGHIIHAQHFAKEALLSNKKLERFKPKPLLIVCQSGVDAPPLAAQLRQAGYDARILAGGMRAWLDAEMPIVKD